MKIRGQQSSFRSGVSAGNHALTLLEMMVSVTLLAVIMIGLLAMFSHTQKALHVAATQTDVFENARGAIQLVTRDLSEMTSYGVTNVVHARFTRFNSPIDPLVLPNGSNQPILLNEAFWLTQGNDDWQGLGYYVSEDPLRGNLGVGTLYRFSSKARRQGAEFLLMEFQKPEPTNSHRVSDGIVHFFMEAVYVSGTNGLGEPVFDRASNISFTGDELPPFVDVEIGVLEPTTLKQFQSLTNNVTAAQNFLRDHSGKIHFFRERVPIRNFINPYRANEVP